MSDVRKFAPEFFEKYPLYRRYAYGCAGSIWMSNLPQHLPSIQAQCNICGCERTFANCNNVFATARRTSEIGHTPLAGMSVALNYACSGCHNWGSERTYVVHF